MNIVINPTKCTAGTTTASNRIASWMSNLLGIRLVDDPAKAKIALGYEIDRVYLVNGVFAFCDFRDEIKWLCQRAKEVVWIGNDYAIILPSQLKFLRDNPKVSRIAQYSNFNNWKNHKYVDFNKLLHWDGPIKPHKHDGLFYYGAFREDRIPAFRHWFSGNEVPVHISTSQRNIENFHSLNRKMSIYKGDRDIRKVLPLFQSSIYIEDTFSHKTTMSPANRFYEVIGSKVLMLYDSRSRRTLEHAGFWDDAFSVSSQTDVAERLKNYDKLREKQIAMFAGRDFKTELEKEFLEAI